MADECGLEILPSFRSETESKEKGGFASPNRVTCGQQVAHYLGLPYNGLLSMRQPYHA
jgi:hypothetical protein